MGQRGIGLTAVAGMLLVIVGAGLIYPPAGVIIAGVGVIIGAALMYDDGKD